MPSVVALADEPAPAAVPPVAIPALQPLTSMNELRPSTPISVPVIVVSADDAGSTDVPEPDDVSPVEQRVEQPAEQRIEPVPAAMPSMFQPLTRPGA
jgi:alpha-beta hydrolase superfamily lysophospholipase